MADTGKGEAAKAGATVAPCHVRDPRTGRGSRDPALELPWTRLAGPKLTDELIDRVVPGTAEQVGARSIKALERYRDECITNVLAAVSDAKAKHGLRFEE